MPPRKGSTSVQVSLPDDLVARLALLATAPGESKSSVMETALRQLIEGSASQTLLEGLHQRIDDIRTALSTLRESSAALALCVQGLGERVTRQEARYEEFTDAVARLYDAEKARQHGTTASPRWTPWLGGSTR